MKGITFIPLNTKFDFIKYHIWGLAIGALVVLGTLGLLATKGLNYGIDFTGGTAIEVVTPVVPDLSDLRQDLNNLGLGEISIQEFGEEDTLLIRMPEQEGGAEDQVAAIDKIREVLDAKYAADGEVDYRRTEFVGPQVGGELKMQGLLAFVLAMAGILIYIWVRFEWQYAVAVVISQIHDCIAVVGFFVLTDMDFSLTAVAAILTVAGYSLNDTVVVFDRIRENLRKYKKLPLAEVLNMSLNQTLSRTVMTGVTTLFSLWALYIFGGEVIRSFVDSLIFGVLVGVYSSIFIATPLLVYLGVRRSQKSGDEQEGA